MNVNKQNTPISLHKRKQTKYIDILHIRKQTKYINILTNKQTKYIDIPQTTNKIHRYPT